MTNAYDEDSSGLPDQGAEIGQAGASLADMLKGLSQDDFLNFGAGQVAYVRPMKINSRSAYAVCAADGRGLSVHLTEGAAVAATKASDLRLMRIH